MTTPELQAALQATAALMGSTVKFAQALKAQAAKAPAAPEKAEIEKAAAALVDHGWLPAADRERAVTVLTDPAGALETLRNLAEKAATERPTPPADPRLAAGTPTAPTPYGSTNGTHKIAAAGQPAVESEADRLYAERLSQYRRS